VARMCGFKAEVYLPITWQTKAKRVCRETALGERYSAHGLGAGAPHRHWA